MAHDSRISSRKRHQSTLSQDQADSKDEANKRRQRNRLSQRSFRERRLAYINELEEASKRAAQSESERNKSLQNENIELRNVYLNLRRKVLGVICTLEEISDEAAKRLNLNCNWGQGDSERPDFDCGGPPTQDNGAAGAHSSFSGVDQPVVSEGEVFAAVPASNIQRPSYAGEMTENLASGNNRMSGSFADLGPQWETSNDITAHPEAAADILLSSDPESCSVAAAPGNSELMYPLQTDASNNEDTYSSNSTRPGDHPTNKHRKPRRSRSSTSPTDEDYAEVLRGNEIVTQRTVIETGQTPLSGVHHHPNTACTASMWDTPLVPRPIPPASHVQGTFHANPNGSLFLEHVDMLESLVHQRLLEMEDKGLESSTSEVIGTAVTLFHDHAWEGTARFWASSQARSILEAVLAWRCRPSSLTLTRLPAAWRPTPLQLYTAHSSIIDWFPHPGLRDSLILNYNNSDILDQLFWDCMDCWTVRVEDISTILANVEPGPGLIGVWNIVEAMDGSKSPQELPNEPDFPTFPLLDLWRTQGAQPGSDYLAGITHAARAPSSTTGNSSGQVDSSHDQTADTMRQPFQKQTSAGEWTPMPLDLILSRSDLARDLFYHLNMYDTVSNWLFDAYLFEKYPELKYPGYESMMAQGTSFRRPSRKVGPSKMSSWTIRLYQKAILGRSTSHFGV